MLTTILPAPWRWAILVTLFAMAAGFGWLEGASHVQARWDAAQAKQADTVARQAVRAATITAAQTHATEEVANNVENRIAAVRSYHAGRLRQPSASGPRPVPPAADASGSPEENSVDDGHPTAGPDSPGETLAERCGVTTEMVLGWQEWWGRIEAVNPLK